MVAQVCGRLPALGLFLLALASAPMPARAETPDAERPLSKARAPYDWSVALYGAAWTDIRFTSIPTDLAQGRGRFENTQIVGLVVNRHLADVSAGMPFTRRRLEGISWEAEGQLIKHFGLEDNWEVTGAIVARTGEFALPFHQSLNLAWGNGLSYALEPPIYERGPTHTRGIDPPQLLWHMSLEADVTPAASPNVSVFFRVHHRSGVYGLIAPRGTGSNFIGLGARVRFQ